ncbi:MAG: hypothetical protein EOM25_15245, partial [Deltaproteobacteria bacterium]|nr:hypothetical protein [Deltaproteobacteria bacterium]
PGKIVVAVLNGELTVKRLVRRGRSLFLAPENPDYEAIPVHEDLDFLVWGVVEAVVRKLR